MSESSDDEDSLLIGEFSGEKADWPMWHKKFLILARRRGYRDILTGTVSVDSKSQQDASQEVIDTFAVRFGTTTTRASSSSQIPTETETAQEAAETTTCSTTGRGGTAVVLTTEEDESTQLKEAKKSVKVGQLNIHAYEDLMLSMENSTSGATVFSLIDNCRSDALPEGDARKAWIALERKFAA